MERRSLTYWNGISIAFTSLMAGLKLTLRHLWKARKSRKPVSITSKNYFEHTEGINAVQFPHVMQPIPDNGRYRLHNEIDDCIVCDKCAVVCPVDCITIEPIRSADEFGKTSDGTPKRIYAARFDIDMGQCCFCGLCTTVCPTECLTMTKVYDFSVFDIKDHNFVFAEMSPTEITEKKLQWDEHQKTKTAAKPVTNPLTSTGGTTAGEQPKPVIKPVFKPKIKPPGPPPAT